MSGRQRVFGVVGWKNAGKTALVARLVAERMPLTVCPYSNIKLRVFDQLKHHNLRQLLQAGLCATVNSDDPAYFGGYVQENYLGCARELELTPAEILQLCRNGFEASWLAAEDKAHWVEQCQRIAASHAA